MDGSGSTFDPPEFLLYLRKSNGRKAVPRQRAITTAYIAQLGGRVGTEFRDADRTAFRKVDGPQPEREGFASMLATLRATPGLGVAAWHADRLTRNDEDTAELIRVCAAGGHAVVTPSGGTYDLSTANGRRRLRDDASAAIYEVDHLTERVLAGRAEVAQEGRWLGGKRPFGWELDRAPVGSDGQPMLDEDENPVRGILRLVPAEADALARACADVIEGAATLNGIARDWNERGILTYTGQLWRGREVGRVLRRPRNAGLMEHQGQVIGAAAWPPIVDETTWRATVAVLDQPGRKTTRGPAPRHLLSFLARCGECGGPVICTATSHAAARGRERKAVYRCREQSTGKRAHVQRDKTQLDDFITQLVVELLSGPDAAELLIKRDDGPDLAALHREAAAIRELMKERDRLHRQRVITTAMLVEGMHELQAELDQLDARIAEAGQADVLAPLVGDLSAAWAALSDDERREIARGRWEACSLDQQRTAIGALMTIRLMPATRKGRPPGWRAGQPYFDPDSVEVVPKRKLPGES